MLLRSQAKGVNQGFEAGPASCEGVADDCVIVLQILSKKLLIRKTLPLEKIMCIFEFSSATARRV